MEDTRTPIERIIRAWKHECGVVRTSEKGTQYVIIPSSEMHESLRILAQTMYDSGYSFEEMDDYRIAVKIADICWREDKIVKMSNSEIKKAKVSIALDWEEAIAPFLGISMSKVEPEELEEVKPKKERILEIYPTDRIKMDTSDTIDAPVDIEFLNELGLDESFIAGKKDE